jgi:hypothetical protein
VQLDRLAVQLRLRNPWEAIDLGFAMVRSWMREVYAPWFAVFLPVCAVALLLLPPQWATLLVWWLKPALDRVVLHVLAAGVFGELPGLRDTLRALPRAVSPGLIASLTWCRFLLARSFDLPVWQLERQRGRAARVRRQQLQRRVGSHAVWLTAACIHFEIALGLSAITLYDLLLPAAGDGEFGLFQLFYGDNEQFAQWSFAIIYFAVVTVLEPAYVGGGFALYLNRRTALEGWDLEVALRRIGQRTPAEPRVPAAAPAGGAIAVSLLAAVLAVASLAPPPAGAQAPPQPAAAERAAQAIKEVLKRPEFDQYRTRTVLEYLGSKKEQEKPRPRSESAGWATFIDALAQLLRILAWAAVGVALVFLAYYLLRHFGLLREARAQYTPPETLFGLDVRPDSLPADIASEAARLARAGELLSALSLLYRGALAALLHRDGVELASGDTEQDCLRKSRPRLPAPAHDYFARLLGAWQQLAYARRRLPAADVESLCAGWAAHFEVRA